MLNEEQAASGTKAAPTTAEVRKDPLTVDAQLSAALLMLRLELNGAQIWAGERANLPATSPKRA